MSNIGELVERLVSQGIPVGEASEIIALAVAAGAATYPHRQSSAAARQKRYRERKEGVTKRNESVTPLLDDEASQSVTNRNESVTRYDSSLSKSNKIDRKRERATQLQDGWRPSDAAWLAAVEKIGDHAAETELVKFRNHAADKGRTSKRWDAAWANWVGKAVDFGAAKPRAGPVAVATVDLDAVVKFFAKTGVWSRGAGPEPSQLGCQAPPELFAKYGLLPDGRKIEAA
jgi:hypothetical protein